ncbi:unnamed protein product [Rodentolepis nana]|uniref:ADF-H domain-containing protein n=1 Tax=Rodentolepis nana TaxID=102285 RepID=A0A0R3T8B3_RODNA|nr:unnamed protein product [Rodentolepis nana]
MSQDKKIQVQKILQTSDVDIFTIMEANLSDDNLKYYQFPGFILYLLSKYRCANSTISRGKTKLYLVFWSEHLEELKRKLDALRNTADQTGRMEDVQAWRW